MTVPSAIQANSDSGSEGAIRQAGGAFGKKEAAQEEQYFRKLVSSMFFCIKSVSLIFTFFPDMYLHIIVYE